MTVIMRDFEFEPKPRKVKAGTVRFVLMNRGTVDHDFAIPSLAVCTVPGHQNAGMWVTVEVGSQ